MKFNQKIIAMMREANKFLQQGQTKEGAAQQKSTLEASQNLVKNVLGGLGIKAPVSPMDLNNQNGMGARDGLSGLSGFSGLNGMHGFDGLNGLKGVNAFAHKNGQHVNAETGVEGSQFISGTYQSAHGSRGYKLYIPSCYAKASSVQALPLVVMLHGCTQNPDDFAVGTGMNHIGEEQGSLVLYPAQSQTANSSKCWNWFKASDQRRGEGEPALIAGMTNEIIARYRVDKSKVYIAGLSAGGAMAVIMGVTYPDIYAAVGIHSGLPYASAQDLPSALAAMKEGVSAGYAPSASAANANVHLKAIPIIVFHGDRDTTVNPRNGSHIMGNIHQSGAKARTEKGSIPNGHQYTRTIHHDDYGKAIAEQWLIHGAGHAWSGGHAHGSYTDARGPDASKEMMRFFSTHAVQVK